MTPVAHVKVDERGRPAGERHWLLERSKTRPGIRPHARLYAPAMGFVGTGLLGTLRQRWRAWFLAYIDRGNDGRVHRRVLVLVPFIAHRLLKPWRWLMPCTWLLTRPL